MKKLRRAHLYLGCFFTPVLALYLFSGFFLTRDEERQKTPDEARSLLQKLYWVHTAQFYPAHAVAPEISEAIQSAADTDTLTTTQPHRFPVGLPVRVIGNDLPGGLESNLDCFARPTGERSLTLHLTEADAKSGRAALDLNHTGAVSFHLNPQLPSRDRAAYDRTLFKYLALAMAIGALATMGLGVVLAFRSVQPRWPVWAALVLGMLVPIVFLWIGQMRKPPPSKAPPEMPALPGALLPGTPDLPPGKLAP